MVICRDVGKRDLTGQVNAENATGRHIGWLALLAPYPSEGMIAWPVSARVGSVKNNDRGLVEPIVLT